MTVATSDLLEKVEASAQRIDADIAWSYLDLASGECASIRGGEAVPVGDQDALIQFLALTRAGDAGAVDLSEMRTLREEHRDDADRGVIGCMSNGLRLSLGDYLAQTVITGDPAAFAVVREAVEEQGASARDLVDAFLAARGFGGLDGREKLSSAGRSGVEIGSTSTDEQISLLRGLLDDSTSAEGRTAESARHGLTVLGSVLKGGGLGRGLPGYGPFKTKIAHIARSGNGNSDLVRSDSAIFFHEGEARCIVSASVSGIPGWQGALPGMALAEDFLREASRACWWASVGTF